MQNKGLQYIDKEKLPFYDGVYYAKNDTIKLTAKGTHLMYLENEIIPIELKWANIILMCWGYNSYL